MEITYGPPVRLSVSLLGVVTIVSVAHKFVSGGGSFALSRKEGRRFGSEQVGCLTSLHFSDDTQQRQV